MHKESILKGDDVKAHKVKNLADWIFIYAVSVLAFLWKKVLFFVWFSMSFN